MKLIPIILLFLVGAVAADEGKSPLDRLASANPSEQAWGAYLAAKEGAPDAIPALIELIETVPGRKDKERRLVVRAVFDALIRLDASVPGKVLEPYLGRYFTVQALILAARSPKLQSELLLKVFDRQGKGTTGGFGIAVGNLLCTKRAPGFTSRLLRHMQQLRLNVSIVEEGFGGRLGGRSIGGSFGDGRLEVPEGYPPTVFYQLTDRDREGSVLLTDGPRPIRWYRTERVGRRLGFGSSSSRVELTELAREWLAVLAGTEVKDLGLPETSSTSLVWTDAAAYVKHVAARRDAILARYWKLVATLVTSKLVSLDEARTLNPHVTLKVYDNRDAPLGGEFPKIPDAPKRPVLPGEEAQAR